MKKRLDTVMKEKGMAPSKAKAAQLIERGVVSVNGQSATKASKLVLEEDQIQVHEENKYVSRGAYKLAAAYDAFAIDAQNKIVADVGASTGGFSDFLLQNGAKKIYAIDVGHDQLDEKLKCNERVINMEGVNIKNSLELPEKVDMCVADLSFISLRLVLKNIHNLAREEADIIVLFKPQFEVGKEENKKGIVAPALAKKALQSFLQWSKEQGFLFQRYVPSPIHGKKGNTEFLIHFVKRSEANQKSD